MKDGDPKTSQKTQKQIKIMYNISLQKRYYKNLGDKYMGAGF